MPPWPAGTGSPSSTSSEDPGGRRESGPATTRASDRLLYAYCTRVGPGSRLCTPGTSPPLAAALLAGLGLRPGGTGRRRRSCGLTLRGRPGLLSGPRPIGCAATCCGVSLELSPGSGGRGTGGVASRRRARLLPDAGWATGWTRTWPDSDATPAWGCWRSGQLHKTAAGITQTLSHRPAPTPSAQRKPSLFISLRSGREHGSAALKCAPGHRAKHFITHVPHAPIHGLEG